MVLAKASHTRSVSPIVVLSCGLGERQHARFRLRHEGEGFVDGANGFLCLPDDLLGHVIQERGIIGWNVPLAPFSKQLRHGEIGGVRLLCETAFLAGAHEDGDLDHRRWHGASLGVDI